MNIYVILNYIICTVENIIINRHAKTKSGEKSLKLNNNALDYGTIFSRYY